MEAEVQLETFPESVLFQQLKETIPWSTKIKLGLLLHRLKQFTGFKEIFKMHKLFEVICALQFSVQTLLITNSNC